MAIFPVLAHFSIIISPHFSFLWFSLRLTNNMILTFFLLPSFLGCILRLFVETKEAQEECGL